MVNTIGPEKSSGLTGKKSSWQTWNVCKETATTFTKLSQYVTAIDNADHQGLEKFVVVMYGRSSAKTIVNGEDWISQTEAVWCNATYLVCTQVTFTAVWSNATYLVCTQVTFTACCLPRRNYLGSSHSPSTCHKNAPPTAISLCYLWAETDCIFCIFLITYFCFIYYVLLLYY